MKLSFENPPARRGGRGDGIYPKFEAALVELRKHPEKWAKVFERDIKSRTYMNALMRRAKLAGFKDDFEMTTRTTNDGKTVALYAQYIGKGKSKGKSSKS